MSNFPVLEMTVLCTGSVEVVEVERTGMMAFHPKVELRTGYVSGKWTVSHFDSGLALCQGLPNREVARKVSLAIERCPMTYGLMGPDHEAAGAVTVQVLRSVLDRLGVDFWD